MIFKACLFDVVEEELGQAGLEIKVLAETVVSALWGRIKTQCPKGEDNFMALPTLDEIEELVCKLGASEILTKEATEGVCRIIKEHLPFGEDVGRLRNGAECLVGQDQDTKPKRVRITSWPCQLLKNLGSLCASLRPRKIVEKEATEIIKEHFPSVKL